MERKKRLLIVNGSQFGYSAGHYYYCLYLKDHFDIEYICFDRGFEKIELTGVNVIYVPFEKSKFRRISTFLKTAIFESRRIKPEILFVVYFNFCFLLSFFCKYKTAVLDIRTGSLAVNTKKRRLDNFLLTQQSLFFNKRIILSESLRLILKIKDKNTLILPLGSEIYFEGDHNYATLNLLYVGVFDGRNISDTINGLGIYLNRYPNRRQETTYTLIGYGSKAEEEKLSSLVRDLKLQDIVNFEGRKKYTEFHSYFKAANIGVSYIPITDYYNAQPPTKTYEYILSGLFTIATGTYENKKIVTHFNGIICEDNPNAFAESITHCFNLKNNLNSSSIRNSLVDYQWKHLVINKLLPFLN